MFPSCLPREVSHLTEATLISLAQQIQAMPIATPLSDESVATAVVHQEVSGQPIVLLHGFDSSLLEFRRLYPQLITKQSTWCLDLLGFGFSERNPQIPLSTENIKTHLYSFWQSQINEPIILVGASMGGAAALDFTLTYPDAVSKLVLLDSAGLTKQPAIGKFMFAPLDKLATGFLSNPKVRQSISRAAYYDKTYASADAQTCAALHLKCDNWAQALISFTKNGGYGSFADRLGEIRQPTLILWGKQDKILGTKDAGKFEQAIPNSKLLWIDDCGHVPHLEQPQATAQELFAWLQAV